LPFGPRSVRGRRLGSCRPSPFAVQKPGDPRGASAAGPVNQGRGLGRHRHRKKTKKKKAALKLRFMTRPRGAGRKFLVRGRAAVRLWPAGRKQLATENKEKRFPSFGYRRAGKRKKKQKGQKEPKEQRRPLKRTWLGAKGFISRPSFAVWERGKGHGRGTSCSAVAAPAETAVGIKVVGQGRFASTDHPATNVAVSSRGRTTTSPIIRLAGMLPTRRMIRPAGVVLRPSGHPSDGTRGSVRDIGTPPAVVAHRFPWEPAGLLARCWRRKEMERKSGGAGGSFG